MTKLDTLLDRWLNEPGFKDKLMNDPEGTVSAAGVSLDADDWAALRNSMIAMSDGELQARISKGWSN